MRNNPTKSNIWEDVSLNKQIIYHVNYASVFNDVISLEELIGRLVEVERHEVLSSINYLTSIGLIVFRMDYLGLPELDYRIDSKSWEMEYSEKLIKEKQNLIRWIGKIPLIKFIGISGSLAAKNPAKSKSNRLDVDIVIITANNTIWIFGIILAFFRKIILAISKHPLCFNLILDESDMMIYNQNFYTANELRNVIPIAGMKTYHKFLDVNRWVEYYYPGLCGLSESPTSVQPTFKLFNNLIFFIFTICRCIKNLSLKPLHNLDFKFNPDRRINYNRRGYDMGGYQLFVHQKFTKNLQKYFSEFYDEKLITAMFDDYLGLKFKKFNFSSSILDPKSSLESNFALKYFNA